MEKQNFNKAKLLNEFFGMYGRGNFDLSEFEINTILDILNKKDKEKVKKLLKDFYELLEKERMG